MNLTDGLTEHLSDLTPPPPDLDRVLQRGEAVRRRRRTVAMGVAAVGLAAVAAAGTGLLTSEPSVEVAVPPISVAGPMELGDGLRAYGDPGGQLRMGGRSFDSADLGSLDTDGLATPKGVVYFSAGRPYLLGEDGSSQPLWTEPVSDPRGWRPTAKGDPRTGVVAFAVRDGDEITLVLRDLHESAGMTLPLDCDGPAGCDGLVVDGVDSGSVFVRTDRGTFRWQYADVPDTGLQPFAGPQTRIADVRNQTVLYDGPRPTVTLDGWTYVAGAIDAQLTLDGWNVLSWSPVLESVRPGGKAIRLQVPGDAVFFNVDTDGSILAATTGDPARFFDCEVPSGACEPIGRLQMTGGDPMFIGNDM